MLSRVQEWFAVLSVLILSGLHVFYHSSRMETVVRLLWNVCLPGFALYVNAAVRLPEFLPHLGLSLKQQPAPYK